MDNSSCNIDQHLLNAYQQTIYQVIDPPISIKTGVVNLVLDAFLRENDATSWAFITAWNPKSQLLSIQENNQRQKELTQMVKKAGFTYFMGEGIGNDPTWTPEESLFILNISKAKAMEFARYFDQNAIVFGVQNESPQLIITVIPPSLPS